MLCFGHLCNSLKTMQLSELMLTTSELSYNRFVFDPRLPEVASSVSNERLQVFVATAFVRIWEQAPGPRGLAASSA